MGAPLKIPSSLDRRGPLVFLGLFALMFVFAGLAMVYATSLQPWLANRDAQNWVETPCWITSIAIKSHNGKNTGLEITYQYQFAGRTLQSQRYDFTPSSASGYAWTAASEHQYRKGTVTVCYVNPQQPSEAVLSRTVENNPMNWMPAVIVLPGLLLLLPVAVGVLRRIKFGESTFELSDAPAPIGGALEGTVTLGRMIQPLEGFAVKLTCIHRTVTGSGKSRSVQEVPLWQNNQQVMSDTSGTVPIGFSLPEDCRETSAVNRDDRIFWRLDVSAKVPGLNYASQFEVPVAQAELSAAEVAEGRKLRAEEAVEIAQFQLPPHSRIRVQNVPAGKEFYFPAFRNVGMIFILTLLTALLVGGLVACIHSGAPLMATLIVGFFALILLCLWVGACFVSWRVVAGSDSLIVTRQLFWHRRLQTIPASDIREVRIIVGTSMGSTVYYNLLIVRQNGPSITAGAEVPDAHEAHWLALEMTKCAGVGE